MEAFFVREGLRAALEVGKIYFLLPLSRNLELLHLLVPGSGCLESFKSESKSTQAVVNVDFRDTQRLPLPHVADQES